MRVSSHDTFAVFRPEGPSVSYCLFELIKFSYVVLHLWSKLKRWEQWPVATLCHWTWPSHQDFLSLSGDGDDKIPLYPSDILDDVCGSDGDPTPSSALPEDLASPSLSDDESSPQDHLSFQHQSIFFPQEDLSIPFDFELRESTVPSGGLGIWSRRKVNVGERFGPYEGEHRPCLQDPTQGWEVGTYINSCISLCYLVTGNKCL